MRPHTILLATAVVLAAVGTEAAVVHTGGNGVPGAPSGCAGPRASDDAQENLRHDQWRATVDLFESDPTLAVWVGFGRVLSTKDVADMFGSTRVEGVALAWKQRQGTTVHAQDQFGPVAACASPPTSTRWPGRTAA